ncbi:MAG: hypothetical protein ACOZHQ_18465 [Thermodesulfobacteriota bacterium]
MRPLAAISAALALALTLGGCAAPPPAKAPPPLGPAGQALEGQAGAAGALRYEDAAQALLAGRAAEAQRQFEALAQAEDPLLARKARYGAAAAALAGARAPAEAQAALARWQAWRGEAPQALTQEDPRLLAPLVEGLAACLAARVSLAGRDELERLKARNAKLGEENAQLKKQLKELEALQRELSERKNRLNR